MVFAHILFIRIEFFQIVQPQAGKLPAQIGIRAAAVDADPPFRVKDAHLILGLLQVDRRCMAEDDGFSFRQGGKAVDPFPYGKLGLILIPPCILLEKLCRAGVNQLKAMIRREIDTGD